MPKNSADSTNPSAAKTELQGLELAEHHFGPLLHPTRATQRAWTNYAINRLQTNQEYGSVLDEDSGEDSDEDEYGYGVELDEIWLSSSIKACVSQIEEEMDLEAGTLQKCITIVYNNTELDDVDPRSTESIVRIYSPSTPMYIDVHFKYHCRARMSEIEWFYSLGYKIQRRPPATAGDVCTIDKGLGQGGPQDVHTHNGWQSICWGYYDDSNGNYGRKWRRVEIAKMELYEEGVMDVHETLFGDLEKPAPTDPEAMLAYRRSLVRSIRLLLAAVGLSYGVACTDDESDVEPNQLMLEGLSDRWVGRGIRNACGLRLAGDAEKERKGAQQRREEAKRYDNPYDSEDDEHYDSEDDECSDQEEGEDEEMDDEFES
ncbi:hypothetical protein DEU56DRAFT_893685 [Suillus clintonianus]|uniref:uncharacterized protein n=1 Tax=Suillus clintonianus TaxID=1904413 RepID=UPI001B86B35F|nr:uncharacterized protein DEU56DRAFT_893685 [Suillus clintonianus]KAG2123410.1 hypothetical protein DEU56DRAFT_893685 [Suillus clintonianus]